MTVTYLIVTTIIIDQKIRLSTPRISRSPPAQLVMAAEGLAEGVDRAGADVAEDDADRADGELDEARLGMVPGRSRRRAARGRGYRSSVRNGNVRISSLSPRRCQGGAGLSTAPVRFATATKRFGPAIDPPISSAQRRAKMRVGVPKEIKVHEYRVGLTPASVAELVAAGHEVIVETKAGARHRFLRPGLCRCRRDASPPTPPRCSPESDMIVKVKEPQAQRDRPARAAAPALHLSPPRPRSRADQGPDGLGRDLHRL